jgi:transcription elongation GreA/GreB family factor
MQSLKEQIVKSCKIHLDHKLNELKSAMQEVTEAGNSETKSTAGDKHETARAMMQLEQEKLGKQLQDAEEQNNDFEKIDFTRINQNIGLGSLIETDKGLFLIATSIGKLVVDDQTVFVISNKSPLAIALNGKKQKDTIVFNGVCYSIKAID